eukprot:12135-Heterococcus_DN1.PRE.2
MTQGLNFVLAIKCHQQLLLLFAVTVTTRSPSSTQLTQCHACSHLSARSQALTQHANFKQLKLYAPSSDPRARIALPTPSKHAA